MATAGIRLEIERKTLSCDLFNTLFEIFIEKDS